MLSNLKILDFSMLLPGPFASLLLADMGADVIKIESPLRPDNIRDLPPKIDTDSAAHHFLNRNKRSLALNLKLPKSTEVIHRLIAEYDIVIESYRPGVMAKLGLDFDTLKQIQPKLIYCSITGYGQTGPDCHKAGHDINFLARAGLLSYSGSQQAGPDLSGTQIADIAGGAYPAVTSILAAVNHRQMTDKGNYLDISIADGALFLNALTSTKTFTTGDNPSQETEPLNGGSVYGIYQTKDKQYLSVGSIEPKFWQVFCRLIEQPELKSQGFGYDLENQARQKAIIASTIQQKTLQAWLDIFADADICVEPVLDLQSALHHPQYQARQMIVKDDKGNQQLAPICKQVSNQQIEFAGRALGADTVSILQGLKFSQQEIEQLDCMS